MTVYQPKTYIEKIYVHMRASEASELRNCLLFHILTLLFLSIFCWYFRYFVGTNDMLVGITTIFQMYRQNFERALLKAWGGGGGGVIHCDHHK